MKILLQPAIGLMRRLRLLPKFILVCLVFLLPLALLAALLMNELAKSVAVAHAERRGVAYLARLHDVTRLVQQRRGFEHLRLNGKADPAGAATQAQVDAAMARLERFQQASPDLAGLAPWRAAVQQWSALRARAGAVGAKESFALHTALIARLGQAAALVADRSQLSLDPDLASNHLGAVFVGPLPDLAEGLSQIAGRGAAFIDTGLFEANEDQLVNATALIARHQLERAPARFDAVFAGRPALATALRAKLAALPAALDFLERAKNEVTNSYNQSSGQQFHAAGVGAVDGLYALGGAAAASLEGLLVERIERDGARRDWMLAAVLLAVLLAAYLFAGFYAGFSHDIERLRRAVRAAAAGNLGQHIDCAGRDEIADLLRGFGGMTRALATLVAEIRSGAAVIAGAGDDIADGNSALSKRTASQSEALGATVLSMRALSATVGRNDANVERGRALVATASGVASHGGASVDAVVDTMASIKASSHKIVDIIGVINGIAFQTNILALNAAVEAARAGNQGRGFAVVAGEVRNLAQRSAAAALEIKGLIGASVAQVEAGGEQVAAAGATMRHMVQAVGQVAAVIGEISAAGAAQSAEIGQVERALAQIDAMTRQNDALAEQAHAGSDRLREESAILAQALSRFQLDGAVPGRPGGQDATRARNTDEIQGEIGVGAASAIALRRVRPAGAWSANQPRAQSAAERQKEHHAAVSARKA